jgi:hypothetical protein
MTVMAENIREQACAMRRQVQNDNESQPAPRGHDFEELAKRLNAASGSANANNRDRSVPFVSHRRTPED